MRGLHEARRHHIGEHVRRPQPRHVRIQPIDVRDAAAEHDHVGIEHVDDSRQPASHAIFVTPEASLGSRVARRGATDDLRRVGLLPAVEKVVTRESGAGQERLDTPGAPAVAGRPRPLAVRCQAGPGQRVVAPLAGDGVRARQHPTVHDHAATRAGADDHAEHAARAGSRTVDRFGQREAVGVVGAAHLAPEPCRQVGGEGVTDEPGGVGVLDQTGRRRDHARHPDPDAGAGAGLPLEPLGERRHRLDRRPIIASRGGDSAFGQRGSARIQRNSRDLGPPKVESHPDPLRHRLTRRG